MHSDNLEAAHFTAVDHTHDPAFFIRFMDEGHRLPAIQASKALVRERLGLRAGDAVLDVGCGPGTSLLELAAAVGGRGRFVGLDVSAAMVEEARRRAAVAGAAVSFAVGDAQALPYPDGAFDVCYVERALMHIPDAERALAKLVRVARPGGRVGAFDFDWDTLVADSPEKETTRTIARTFADAIRHGWIGRQLPRLCRERGLVAVSVDAIPVFVGYAFAELLLGGHCTRLQAEGILAPAQVRRWWEGLREAEERGVFLLGFTAFLVAGVKPGGA